MFGLIFALGNWVIRFQSDRQEHLLASQTQ
jgi:hypothetical protein